MPNFCKKKSNRARPHGTLTFPSKMQKKRFFQIWKKLMFNSSARFRHLARHLECTGHYKKNVTTQKKRELAPPGNIPLHITCNGCYTPSVMVCTGALHFMEMGITFCQKNAMSRTWLGARWMDVATECFKIKAILLILLSWTTFRSEVKRLRKGRYILAKKALHGRYIF